MSVGDLVTFDQRAWTVTEFGAGGTVLLVSDTVSRTVTLTWLLTRADVVFVAHAHGTEPGTAQPQPWRPGSVTDTLLAWGIDHPEAIRSEEEAAQLTRYRTGFPYGAPLKPDEAEDLEIGPRSGRSVLERKTILGKRLGVGPRHADRKLTAYGEIGLAALPDHRRRSPFFALGGCPVRLQPIIRTIVSEELSGDGSYRPNRTLAMEAMARYRRRYPREIVPPPQKVQRWVGRLIKQHGGRPDKTKTARSNQVNRFQSPVRRPASAPLQHVIIDETALDVAILDPVTGETEPCILLHAKCEFSRAFVAWDIIPVSERTGDLGLLLYQILTPRACPEEWGPRARFLFGRFSEVTVDNALTFISPAARRACERLGASITLARRKVGIDKAISERSHGSIGSAFLSWIDSYTGGDVSRRGVDSEGRAKFFRHELLEYFSRYIATVHMHTPHKGLRVVGVDENVYLTPAQRFDQGVAATGFIPLQRDPEIALTLLRQERRTLGTDGFSIKPLKYAAPILDKYFGVAPPFGSDEHVLFRHPGDLSRVWFFAYDIDDPRKGEWVPLPATGMNSARPFEDAHLAHLREGLYRDGIRYPSPQQYTEALLDLFYEISDEQHARSRKLGRAEARAHDVRARQDAHGLTGPIPAYYADPATAFADTAEDPKPPRPPWGTTPSNVAPPRPKALLKVPGPVPHEDHSDKDFDDLPEDYYDDEDLWGDEHDSP